MSNRKNLILIVISLILLLYAGLMSVYPAFLNATFSKTKFGQKVYDSVGLVTTIDKINFEMKPNLTLIVTINNWSSKYVDYQDCFEAGVIELQTGAFSPFTKNFPIKELYLKHVKCSNLILPNGKNKLAYLPSSFGASPFGAKVIKIGAGPVRVQDFRIKHIYPDISEDDNRSESIYSKTDVKKFLQELNIRFVEVR